VTSVGQWSELISGHLARVSLREGKAVILFTDFLTKLSIEISQNTLFDTSTKKYCISNLKYFSRKCFVSKINGSIAFTISNYTTLLFSDIFIIEADGGTAAPMALRLARSLLMRSSLFAVVTFNVWIWGMLNEFVRDLCRGFKWKKLAMFSSLKRCDCELCVISYESDVSQCCWCNCYATLNLLTSVTVKLLIEAPGF